MPNPQYIKGIRFERKLVNEAKEDGYTAFRTAGSHSPIDVCIIDEILKEIRFIQCKHTKRKQIKLKKDFEKSGLYLVKFEVIEK